MGIGPGSRCRSSPYAVPDSNPNPLSFVILAETARGKYLTLLVHYPNCTNYEGHKLLVYEGFRNSRQLLKHNKGALDPHFSAKKGSPLARFRPDRKGKAALAVFLQAVSA